MPFKPHQSLNRYAAGTSISKIAVTFKIMGTVTVPLARIIEAKIEPAPKNKIAHNTINSKFCPSSMTLGSVINNAIKYLENKFPAYVVHPREGTPVNLFGVGLFKDCRQEQGALEFMGWLLGSDRVQAVAQTHNTGYLFIFPRGINEAPVDEKKLWLNRIFPT